MAGWVSDQDDVSHLNIIANPGKFTQSSKHPSWDWQREQLTPN
jgi:hypothetical protein